MTRGTQRTAIAAFLALTGLAPGVRASMMVSAYEADRNLFANLASPAANTGESPAWQDSAWITHPSAIGNASPAGPNAAAMARLSVPGAEPYELSIDIRLTAPGFPCAETLLNAIGSVLDVNSQSARVYVPGGANGGGISVALRFVPDTPLSAYADTSADLDSARLMEIAQTPGASKPYLDEILSGTGNSSSPRLR